jgi:hypothetical protein
LFEHCYDGTNATKQRVFDEAKAGRLVDGIHSYLYTYGPTQTITYWVLVGNKPIGKAIACPKGMVLDRRFLK